MRRFFWLFPLALAGACTGLYLEHGNAYPCDFSKGPEVRDAVCLAGDICGTNNTCQPFIYEGPRFEGPASLPVYGPNSGEGAVLHPLVLNSNAFGVTSDVPTTRGPTGYVQLANGIFQVRGGHVGASTIMLPSNLPVGFGTLKTAQTFFSGAGPVPNVLLVSDSGKLAIGTPGVPMTDAVRVGVTPFVSTGFRVVDLPPSINPQGVPVTWNTTDLGVVLKRGASWEFASWVTNPGTVLDVASLTLPARLWLFVLQPDQLGLVDASDAGVSVVATMDTLVGSGGSLKTDPGNRILAATRTGSLIPVGPQVDVLSTFQVTITGGEPGLTSPWPDCVPCPPGQRASVVAPSVRTGAPTVDVLCVVNGPFALALPKPVRVVGSVALTQFDACLTEDPEVPLALARVARTPEGGIVHWNGQAGLFLGGRHGELWSGESLTTLEPEFLDRVPRDVAPALAGNTPSIAVIADDYLAIQQTEDTRAALEQLNGFRRLPQRELGVSEGSRLLGFVHGIGGWAIAGGGELVRVRVTDGGVAKVEHGVQLVTANEDPVRDSIGGEAYLQPDGGRVGFYIAADDSLYLVQDPESSFLPENEGEVALPDLTPEPSVPIRSLALERTPLGTDGLNKARGYLVTSRNVYAWELGGSPARWSSTPLVLSSGEPMEVWFDSTRSALGRVGYRDGQIFSLPGGYLLADALPAVGDGDVVAQVLDYENLGGWPVAYATTGVFIAGWDQVDGKLQNRFASGINRPMTWRELKLAGDATPWMRRLPDGGVPRVEETKPGKLFVAQDDKRAASDGGIEQEYRLMLFLDDQVLQLARHVRNVK